MVEAAFQKAFNMADSNGGYERFKEFWKANTLKGTEEFDPIKAVMYAFQGDASVVGLTQYFTGGMKRWLPAITSITDRMYPNLRFKNNPMFWVHEYIESPFLNAARGVDKGRLIAHTKRGEMLAVSAGEVRDLSKVGPEMHSIVDNVNFVQTMRSDAVRRATTGDWSVGGLLKESVLGRAGTYLKDMKESYKDDLAMDVKANMADAGYDMGTIGKELDALDAEARIMADYVRKNPDVGSIDKLNKEVAPMFERYQETLRSTRRAFNRLSRDRMKANYRYVAAQQILLQAGFREGAGLSFEGDRIAQALALGHSYGADIGDVASMLQKVVDDVASDFPDAYIISEQFDETVGLARPIGMETTKIETVQDLAKASYIGEGGLPRKMVESLRAKVQEPITTYSNLELSLFERTINHPFLGFYPYSYMFKKILPEMVQFLFKRPFGAMAPGAGYQAYAHVRDYVEHQVETDYFFRKTLEDNNEVAFLVSQLFPGLPWDIAAVPPAYLRNIVLSTAGGRDKEYNILEDLIGRDVLTRGSRFGPVNTAQNFAGAANQLITELSGGNKPKPAVTPGYKGLPDFNIGG